MIMTPERTHPLAPVRITAILKEKEFWLLLVLWLLYCYRPLFLGDTFFFRDVTYFFFPQEKLFANLLNAGDAPFWDAYHHGGHAYLADVNNSPLYPANLLFVFLPAVKAFSVFVVAHYILCSLSSYLFARVLGLQKAASFLVGLVYGFCGYTRSLNDHPTRLAALSLLPLIFLCWHLFLSEHRKKWFILASFLGMFQVIVGAPEVNVLMMLSLLGWTVVYPYPGFSYRRRFAAWILLGFFILGLASFQIFPILVAVGQSTRGEGLDYHVFSQWSLHPGRLPEFLFPAFRGYLDRLPYNLYFWGGDLGDRGYPYIPNIYCGCVVIALAVVGIFSKKPSPFPLQTRRFLGWWFASLLVLSLGRFLPFFPLVYRYVPVISIVRYPIKFLLAGPFPLALLAGCGAEILFGKHSFPISRTLVNCLAGISGLLIGGTLVFWGSRSVADFIQQVLFHRAGSEISHLGMALSLVQASVVWSVFTFLVISRRFTRVTWQRWVLAGILTLDLLLAGKRVAPLAPQTFFTEEPALAQFIRSEIAGGKLYRTPDPLPTMFHFPADKRFPIPPDHVMWLYRWQLETLRKYLAANYNIPVIFHRDYNKMASRHLVRLTELIETLPWPRKLPILSVGGVTLILSGEEDLSVWGLERVAEIPNWSDLPLFLYRNPQAVPRAEFVTHWKRASSDEEALTLMLHPDYDPRRHVVLQHPRQESFFSPFLHRKSVEIESFLAESCDETPDWNITTTAQTSRSVTFTVSTNCDGYLVLSDLLYPGWTMRVNGNVQPALRANFAFSAIPLKSGEYDIEYSYFPTGLLAGTASSLVFCGLLALLPYKRKSFVGRIHETPQK
ncbi:hypothetical protein CSA56_03860 [candidate division KSB3 bacterium]|uniref:Membrane protein 6-pyruvoyl-tetrahydropterin synthase-related domain-containing protein n=1 Tax=candidate division KSB3 bacterium TaxID=2044937 RepID=A0A2G6KJK5_9BACT|nr:MAG: hypothetical protein CSA56_03860 [candidate division KSB3 bacterium]